MRALRSSSTPLIGRSNYDAVTLLELLVVVAILGVLMALIIPGITAARQMARQVQCTNNIRQFAAADIAYFNDSGQLPPLDGMVPSSITEAHLARMAQYLHLNIPPGPVSTWPKRALQPGWYNCPMAQYSGYAEGLTLGGGVYTGYEYAGAIQESTMVTTGIITVLNPGHSADQKLLNRGVLWADVLGQFLGAGSRSYECFHVRPDRHYPDFVFYQTDLAGIHRAWSDGSVDWVPINNLDVSGPGSPDAQINFLGGYIYYY